MNVDKNEKSFHEFVEFWDPNGETVDSLIQVCRLQSLQELVSWVEAMGVWTLWRVRDLWNIEKA